jgi:hypothetical protein
MEYIIMNDIPVGKIHSRLCVYTFVDNEGRKKKIPLKYLNKKQ